jgi:hypothetical protein
MVSRIFSRLIPVRVTVGYAVLLVLVATTLLVLGPRVQNLVVSHMSTNLHNLARGHLGTLLGSAFVAASGPIYIWLPGLVCLLALAELFWRSGRMILAFALGHIGATLIVAVGMAAAIQFGWLPISVARASDVGMSYGAVAVLGALTAAIPSRWRPAWIGGWLATALVVVAVSAQDFTDAGHGVALVLGMLLSTRFRAAARWTPVRLVLLGVGGAFGYLVLVNTELSLLTAPVAGLAGVAIAQWVTRRWRTRRAGEPLAVAAVITQEPVLR